MSNVFSMSFSVISSKISLLKDFFVVIPGLLHGTYCFVGVRNWVSIFFIIIIIIIIFLECDFHSFFLPSPHLVLCYYVLDRLVGGFNYLFSFP
jgi:hypothetical protein